MSANAENVVAVLANREKHRRNIWEWRNDVDTRKSCRTMDKVPWESHTKWFDNLLKTSPETIFMCCLGGEDICMVRFSNIDLPNRSNCYEISLNMNPAFRGRRLASKCIHAGIESFTSQNLGIPISYIIAEIKVGNIPSIKSFIRSGFVHNGLVPGADPTTPMLQFIYFCNFFWSKSMVVRTSIFYEVIEFFFCWDFKINNYRSNLQKQTTVINHNKWKKANNQINYIGVCYDYAIE